MKKEIIFPENFFADMICDVRVQWSFIKHGRSKNITNPIFSHLNFVVLRCVPNRLYVVSYNKYFLPFLFEDLLKSINNFWQQDLDEQTFKK